MKWINVDLYDIQPIFSREIAGNHTVHATLDDGAVVCSCLWEDAPDGPAMFYFLGFDEHLSDWHLLTIAEARKMIDELAPKKPPRRRR